MSHFIDTQKIYTISELNEIIREKIDTEFPEFIWLCGEVRDLRIRKDKKHIYLNLCQKHPEADYIIAQVKAIIFENRKNYIQRRLKTANLSLSLREGIEIKVLCKVSFYPPWGEIRVVIYDIDPLFTLGSLTKTRQRILKELERRKLINKNKSLDLPLVPLNIGLITSFDSAAYHDFISELKNSGFGFRIYFYNAYMQGENVERDIVEALSLFNRLKNLDVIVITRGGGGSADLGWFDNINIAINIAYSRFPVLTGIGHQINLTIADIVSYAHFKTPTAIAQFLCAKVDNFMRNIDNIRDNLVLKTQRLFKDNKENLYKKIVQVQRVSVESFREWYNKIIITKVDLEKLVDSLFKGKMKSLQEAKSYMKLNLTNSLNSLNKDLDIFQEKVRLLNPLNVLKRGFSITLKDGKVIKDASILKNRDQIETILYKGKIKSEVTDFYAQEEVNF